MSQLIQMRQRIKAVETIKKITHAMRLIAMSSHARLRTQAAELIAYQQELSRLLTLTKDSIIFSDEEVSEVQNKKESTLIILIGSQKGLCGNFNNELIYFFNTHVKEPSSITLITVGKKVKEYLDEKKQYVIAKEFDQLRGTTLISLARNLTEDIKNSSYTKVVIISNVSKSFFVQRPTYTELPHSYTPILSDAQHYTTQGEYRWYQPAPEITQALSEELLYSIVYERLLSSLIAEQAARFVAMDGSTRNAQTLLDDMKLSYNKLRQSKITRELTDLVGSFFKTT